MDQGRRQTLQQMFLFSTGLIGCCGCRTAPITGRKQLLLMPEDQEIALGLSAYEESTSSQQPSRNQQYVEMVNRVGARIAEVAERPDYKWEFRTIAAPDQNAYALPGGKVAVYEGILPVCANEAGLAVVMSHEVAHALARHGGERMSQNYAVDGVKQAVNFVTRKQDKSKQEMVMKAYGVASEYGVILPYSRKHESEADHMGIMLMARAGYDPAEAPRFWQRFSTMKPGEKPAEFLSTHPSDDRRAADLTALLPEAQKLFAAAPRKIGLGEMLAAAPLPPPQQPFAPRQSGPQGFDAGYNRRANAAAWQPPPFGG